MPSHLNTLQVNMLDAVAEPGVEQGDVGTEGDALLARPDIVDLTSTHAAGGSGDEGRDGEGRVGPTRDDRGTGLGEGNIEAVHSPVLVVQAEATCTGEPARDEPGGANQGKQPAPLSRHVMPHVLEYKYVRGTSHVEQGQASDQCPDADAVSVQLRLRVRRNVHTPIAVVIQTGGPTHHFTATNLGIVEHITGKEITSAVCGLTEDGLPVFINPVTKGILGRPRQEGAVLVWGRSWDFTQRCLQANISGDAGRAVLLKLSICK